MDPVQTDADMFGPTKWQVVAAGRPDLVLLGENGRPRVFDFGPDIHATTQAVRAMFPRDRVFRVPTGGRKRFDMNPVWLCRVPG